MAQGFTPQDWLGAIYVAYWGRAADPEGLDYWVNMWGGQDDQGRTQDAAWFASNFALQPEAAEAYPYFEAFQNQQDITPDMRGDFIDAIYDNLFNRAPDQDGKAYWLEQLETGTVDPGEFIAAIVHSALAGGGDDAQTVTAKMDVAAVMTANVRSRGWTGEPQVIDYLRGDEARDLIADTTPANAAALMEEAGRQFVMFGDGNVMISMHASELFGDDWKDNSHIHNPQQNFDELNLGGGINRINLDIDDMTPEVFWFHPEVQQILGEIQGFDVLGIQTTYPYDGGIAMLQGAFEADYTVTDINLFKNFVTVLDEVSTTFTTTFAGPYDELELIFWEDFQGNLVFTGYEITDGLIIIEADGTYNGSLNFAGGEAGVEIMAGDDFTATITGDLTLLDLVGDEEHPDFHVALVDVSSLEAIWLDLAGSGTVTIDASAANFGNAVYIDLGGDHDLDYTAFDGQRETFVLYEDYLNGDIEIHGFRTGAEDDRDRLDFGDLGSLADSAGQLNVDIVDGNTLITAAADEFSGSITLVGVTDFDLDRDAEF